ncbi:uncharacterized protein LOC110861859 isoform X2 [Folsomia candida]|uniref:uncharacterized protein LOC110861859 isoform X2 n=1 Tax=Folsomia candida TaxID=158441 RepID=UPI001605599A|nr:uncharacterized protein LOC110861859 isoform X2 [Folsomia candida]
MTTTPLVQIHLAGEILCQHVVVLEDLSRLFRTMQLEEITIRDIVRNPQDSTRDKIYKGLQAWKEANGSGATVERLVGILESLNHRNAAETIQNAAGELGPQEVPQIPGSSAPVRIEAPSAANLEDESRGPLVAQETTATLTISNGSQPTHDNADAQINGYMKNIKAQRRPICRKKRLTISLLITGIVIASLLTAWIHATIKTKLLNKDPAQGTEVATPIQNYHTTPPVAKGRENLCLRLSKDDKQRCREISPQNDRLVTLNSNNQHDFCDGETTGRFLGGNLNASSGQEFCPHNLVALEILVTIEGNQLTNFLDRYCQLKSLSFEKNASLLGSIAYPKEKRDFPLESLYFIGTLNVVEILNNLSEHFGLPCLIEINLVCINMMAGENASIRTFVASHTSVRRINCKDDDFCHNLADIKNTNELKVNYASTGC